MRTDVGIGGEVHGRAVVPAAPGALAEAQRQSYETQLTQLGGALGALLGA
jgi:hypothetical protein